MEQISTTTIRRLSRQFAAHCRAPRVVRMEVLVTGRCNLLCTYCHVDRAKGEGDMSYETARTAVDFLIDSSRGAECIGITFLGGEPMKKFDLIRETIGYAKPAARRAGKKVLFGMQTNGLLISEEHASYFRDAGLRYCLSVDGAQSTNDRYRMTTNARGTYAVLSRKMGLLKRYQPWQGARMTVMPSDARRLGENIRRLHEDLGINQFIFGVATRVEWENSQVADYVHGLLDAYEYWIERQTHSPHRFRIGFFEALHNDTGQDDVSGCREKRWGCGAGSGRIAVSPNGVLHGCSKLAWVAGDGAGSHSLRLGTVATGMTEIQNRSRLLAHGVAPRSKCASCEIAGRCNGGCYAANLADGHNMYIPADYYCKLMFAQNHILDCIRCDRRTLPTAGSAAQRERVDV